MSKVVVGDFEGRPIYAYAPETRPLAIGDVLHGFCRGYLGRDHYDCSVVEAVGVDWVVVRPLTGGASEFASGREAMVALREHRAPVVATGYTDGCGCGGGGEQR